MSLTGATNPAITSVSSNTANKKTIKGASVAKGLASTNGQQGDAAAQIGKAGANATSSAVFTSTGSLVRKDINKGVENSFLTRTPVIPGTPGSGTPNNQGGTSTTIGDIGTGAAGDGRGVAGYGASIGAQLAIGLASAAGAGLGPGMGFGGLGNIGFGSGTSPSNSPNSNNSSKNNSENNSGNNSGTGKVTPPEANPTTTPSTPNTSPTDPEAKEALKQSKVNDELLENYNHFTKDGKLTQQGEKTLNERSQSIDVQDKTVFDSYYKKFKNAMNTAENDDKRKEALETFKEDLKIQELDPEKVLQELLKKE